jgi:A/G-specific adenine glycosylase
MPWRDNTEPYYVLVSELMLQQTQVDRVIPKFEQFISLFPDVQSLAAAPLSDVLTAWSGLGYNRRAKFLHAAAKKVVDEHGGVIPDTHEGLVSLPGIGPNTAGAILAYSFNRPVTYIETNVRTVFFHHFFEGQPSVSDKELKEIVTEAVDEEHPREWYWGVMDYGAYLKKQGVGRNDKSSHYKKQAPLKGSLREVRGLILKALAQADQPYEELKRSLPQDERFETALGALTKEGFVERKGERLHLAE